MADSNDEETGEQKTFVFRGGMLVLDLVNTEAVVRGKKLDLLEKPADLKNWWAEVQQQHAVPPVKIAGSADKEAEQEDIFDSALLEQVKILRLSLRNIFEAKVSAAPINQTDLAILNSSLRLGNFLVEEAGGDFAGAYSLETARDEILFQSGFGAFHLLTAHETSRLHKCRNGRCILFFYDSTKSGTRHWCSLGCMNRARSSENYRQRKQAHSTKNDS